MSEVKKIELYNCDCMELMAKYPDNHFDLAIVDPPYGIDMDGGKIGIDGAGKAKQYTKYDWDKNKVGGYFADAELAWTSFDTAVRTFKWTWHGFIQQNMGNKQKRIHPTEKPIQLYQWILQNYAKEGDLILDTHLGSASIAIACHREKFSLVGCELIEEYYLAGLKRLENEQMQTTLF